jgi:hypothetical protein
MHEQVINIALGWLLQHLLQQEKFTLFKGFNRLFSGFSAVLSLSTGSYILHINDMMNQLTSSNICHLTIFAIFHEYC